MTAPRRTWARGSARGGFLLLEALTTLALGALVIAGLSTVIVLMLRFSDRTAADLGRREVLGRALQTVEQEIRDMARLRLGGAQDAPFLFSGHPDRLLFTLDRLDDNGLDAPVAVAYRTGTRDGVTRLARAEAAVPPAATDAAALVFGKPATVYAGDRGIRFAFFAPQPDGSGEVLMDDWKQPAKMPTAVRIAVIAPDGTIEESTRVPLLVDAEPGCAVPGKGFCSLPGAEQQAKDGAGDHASDGSARQPGGQPKGDTK